MKVFLISAVLVTWLAMPAIADEPPPPPKRTPNLFTIGLGGSFWPELHDLDPSSSPFAADLGLFHTWGIAIDFSYQRRVARWGDVDALFGVDLAITSHENADDIEFVVLPFGDTFDGTLTATTFSLTPSVRFVVADSDRWRFLVGAGAGLYVAGFDDTFSEFYGYEDDDALWDDTTFGGFLSAAGDYEFHSERPRWRLRFETKVHLVDFGDTAPFAPGSGDLTGPNQTLVVSFVWDR